METNKRQRFLRHENTGFYWRGNSQKNLSLQYVLLKIFEQFFWSDTEQKCANVDFFA
jgi:hypothetical protein